MDMLIGFQDLFGQIVSHQATQFGLAFTLAAVIHARQVRKEIALQMGSVASSIDAVANVLKEDLKKQSESISLQSKRLSSVEDKFYAIDDGLKKLNVRVEKLETTKEI